MTDADMLDDVVARLVSIRTAFGSAPFGEAARKCAVAIARVALAEAEARAGGRRRKASGRVVPFPLLPRDAK
jgi:hypothetical protein